MIAKANEKGEAIRFKSRLVIHGFKQTYGVDFIETYAPAVRFCTIRVAIYYALQHKWSVIQYDIRTAFLYGKLDEQVYMNQSQGYMNGGSGHVCVLIKSLYGLKQAPYVWNQTLHAY